MSDAWLLVTRSAVNTYIDMTILTFTSNLSSKRKDCVTGKKSVCEGG